MRLSASGKVKSMVEYLIVDGYNMIGSWPELRELAERRLEDARDRLIDLLADYQGYTGMKVIVVFDAHQVPGIGGKYKQHRIEIQYTKSDETADERIERLVFELVHRRRHVYVATSDHAEQHVVFGKGALRISARELLIDIQQSQLEIKQQIDTDPGSKRNTFDSKLTSELRHTFERWRRDQ